MNFKCVLNKQISFHPVAGAHPFVCIESSNTNQVHFSLSVRAGHFYDPDDCQGLAHLLEHMLFLGSRLQPAPNQIIQFIQKAGGTVNAWTSGEFANYHFSCPVEFFKDIAPAFLETLFHPLLRIEKIEKEIEAIDAEFKFKRKDELRRLYQIHKETCNPNHPFSKFSVGNAEIFRHVNIKTLRSKLQAFHRSRYGKDNIRIAVCGPDLCDTHLAMITGALESLPIVAPKANNWPKLYRQQDLQILINVKPLQQAKRLIITFALQTEIKPIENALYYISHILGDESKHSLLAYLKSKDWASNLVAGGGIEGTGFKDFNINIQLSDTGEQHIPSILEALFYSLTLIKKDDATWRREEKAQLDRLAREYSESPPSLDDVCEYAERLFEDMDYLNRATCSKQELHRALALMTTETLRIKLISPNITTSKTCQYYNANYHIEALDAELIKRCQQPKQIKHIQLPQKNRFVCEHPELLTRHPEWQHLTNIGRNGNNIWFRQDDTYNSVKGDLFSSFDLPAFCIDSHSSAVKRIWLNAVNTHLQESLYQAGIAGLHYRTYGHQCGFTLHCRGFTNALLPLAKRVLTSSLTFPISQSAFQQAHSAQLRSLANSLLNKPINRLLSRLGVVIQKHSYTPAMLLEAMQSMQYESFQQGLEHAFTSGFNESMLNGNWSIADAQTWSTTLAELDFEYTHCAIPREVLKLQTGALLVNRVECEHDDAAIVLYLQAPNASPKYTAFCMILEQLLAGPYFNALRTEQQLGYVVGTGYVPHNQHPGIVFYIQSPTHSADALWTAMLSFLKEQINDLVFYRNYWPAIRHNLLKQVSESDSNLAMQSQRLWLNLATGDAVNARENQLIKEIEQFSFDHLVTEAESMLKRGVFGELLLYAQGKFAPLSPEFGDNINDLTHFKTQANFF